MAILSNNLVEWDWGGKREDEGRCCQFVQVFSCGCISKVTQNTPIFHQKTCMLFGHSTVDCSRMASTPRSILLGDACSACSVKKNEVIRITEDHPSNEQTTPNPSSVEAQSDEFTHLEIADKFVQDIKDCVGSGDTKVEVVEEGAVKDVEEIAEYQDVQHEFNQDVAKGDDEDFEERGNLSQSTIQVKVSAGCSNSSNREEFDDKVSLVTSSSTLTEAGTETVSCITELTALSKLAATSTTKLAPSLSPATMFRARMEAAALQGLQLNLNLNFKRKLEADKAKKELHAKNSKDGFVLKSECERVGFE